MVSDEITLEAPVADPLPFARLFALGQEWSTAMREVYWSPVIGGGLRLTAGRGGVGSERIARGWPQREATLGSHGG